ncbi:carbohydrate ABC transporter permease [Nonomuraea sp. B19D2]|uniref:carbohydrate ABC transporter permease n=1 Tax=Nonomuraea sp. B19D2 TaxID=3159561 RepID=UPI0032DA4A11
MVDPLIEQGEAHERRRSLPPREGGGSILPAYAFARLRSRMRGVAFALMLGTMMIPAQVVIVPRFLLFSQLDLVDTFWPLFLPNFFGTALYIFLLRQFFTTIPQELVEAARIDGAGELRILWRIMIPLSKPAIATVTPVRRRLCATNADGGCDVEDRELRMRCCAGDGGRSSGIAHAGGGPKPPRAAAA